VLGVFSIVQTFGLLLIGIRVLSHPHLQDYFGQASEDQLQTVAVGRGGERRSAHVNGDLLKRLLPKSGRGEHMGSGRRGRVSRSSTPRSLVSRFAALPASGVTGRTKFNGINDSCKFFCG